MNTSVECFLMVWFQLRFSCLILPIFPVKLTNLCNGRALITIYRLLLFQWQDKLVLYFPVHLIISSLQCRRPNLFKPNRASWNIQPQIMHRWLRMKQIRNVTIYDVMNKCIWVGQRYALIYIMSLMYSCIPIIILSFRVNNGNLAFQE